MKQGRGRFLVAGFPQRGCVLIISLELKILYRGPWVGKSVFPGGHSQFFGMFKVCLFGGIFRSLSAALVSSLWMALFLFLGQRSISLL